MTDVLNGLGAMGVVPVVTIHRAEDALALGRALLEGGLPCAEITLRTDAAEQAIRELRSSLRELIVGAGTVLSVERAQRATAAGAQFLVSPGFSPKVVDWCLQQGIVVVPGVATPTEIEMGLERGLNVLKFFPAEAMGGVAILRALSAPYAGVSFIPTGGVTLHNLCAYLSLPNVLCCGGSWLVNSSLISAGKFDQITALAREAVAVVRDARR